MFRLIKLVFQVVKYLVNSSEEDIQHSPAGANSKKSATTTSFNNIPGEYHERDEKTVNGKVTHLYQEYGLIDSYVYFTKDDVKSEGSLKLEDAVEVIAVRGARHTGWRAVSVLIVSDDWDTIRNVYHTHGTVTNINRDGDGAVDYKYKFTQSCCKDYQPWKGDKVRIEMLDNGTTTTIQSVRPFATQKYTGRVVHVGQSYCFIDGDLAFSRQCCIDGYAPTSGDLVCGDMMECDQGQRWKHRAITVSKVERVKPNGANGRGDGAMSSHRSVNKDFIFIQGELTFVNVEVGSSKTHTVFVRNGTKDPLKLLSISIEDKAASQFALSKPKISLEGQFSTQNVITSQTVTVLPGMTFYFTLTFTPRYIGDDRQVLTLQFDGFLMNRQLLGSCIPITTQQSVKNSDYRSPGNRYRQIRHNIDTSEQSRSVMPGVRPAFRAARLPKNLPQFEVPRDFRSCVLNDTQQLKYLQPNLDEELSSTNYVSKFDSLLYLEEINAEVEIRKFDIDQAVFGRSRGFLTLIVPGLPDGQPCLYVGDKLSVTVNSHMQPVEYEGYIHDTIQETVYTKFHSSFHDSYNEEECYVIFYISRVPFRRMHQAVKLAHQMAWPGLFPQQVTIKSSRVSQLDSLDVGDGSWLHNKRLNVEQRLAVKRVLQAKCRPFPYVIFGPPGTGKTMTIVECVLQVFSQIRGSRILICTPSNSAADLLTLQLARGKDSWCETDLVRLISYRRLEESLPEEIRYLCQDGSDLKTLSQHRIIIATCVSAGMLFSLGLSTKHFTHVFVDEAGQAGEPECLVPISLIAANPEACIVLAGDHKQLGAVVKCRIAEERGLTVSLLERIMNYQPYSRHEHGFEDHSCYDPNLVTKLVRNYRAHPVILSLYSPLFYDNELIISAGPEAYSLETIQELITPGKPLIFHGVQGEELREGDNPSWFNAVEVVQVVKYLKVALSYCDPEDIGVITPYKKQVEKIRQLMECVGVTRDVKVGSVEEFQGQERRVIIVSTVRSRADNLDALGNVTQVLGFLGNCKRFNVTISRAMALLVVIGNPFVLSKDYHWKYLIDYSVSNDCYVGTPYE